MIDGQGVAEVAGRARRQRVRRRLLSVAVLGFGVFIVHNFVASLVWAAVIGIAVAPLYARIERRWPRLKGGVLLPGLVTALIALLVLIPVGLGVARAAAEAQDVAHWVGSARQNGIPVPHWVMTLPIGSEQAGRWWQDHLATPEGTRAALAQVDGQSLIYHTRLAGKELVHRSIIFFFTLLALFFILRDGDLLIAQGRRAGERMFGPSAERIGHQVVQSVRGTIGGLVLVGIGEGAVMTLAYLGFGVPHPLLLGAATAVAAMIPFGAALLFAIAAIMLLAQEHLPAAIAVVAIGLAVVGLADHLIRPALIGGATRLPFLWVLVGILGGVETLGLLGLFVGPATMAVLVMLWRELIGEGAAPAASTPT